jgi:hypothetical protein
LRRGEARHRVVYEPVGFCHAIQTDTKRQPGMGNPRVLLNRVPNERRRVGAAASFVSATV